MNTTFGQDERRSCRSTAALAAVAALPSALLTGLGVAGSAQAATVDTNGWYALVNRGSGKALDVSGGSATNSTC
ncbi:hypothetical protein [Streptomyces sp. NPDC006551]|uniref:hypothetical protein n=1 Tax=Streptomyces sp. NPDC006551 TaxID=3157178 RepID=UPI0033B0B007